MSWISHIILFSYVPVTHQRHIIEKCEAGNCDHQLFLHCVPSVNNLVSAGIKMIMNGSRPAVVSTASEELTQNSSHH